MPTRKALALDLDGTLLRSDRTVSEFNARMIRRCVELGWVVIISTARPVRTIRGLLPAEFAGHYWAACNGAWVVWNGEIIARNDIAGDVADGLIRWFGEAGYDFSIEANDCLYSGWKHASMFGRTFPIAEFTPQPVQKFLIDVSHPFEEAAFRANLPASCGYVITDGGKLVQLAAATCSKLAAVQHVLALEGIPLADTIAFGDDNNDIPLLQAAGLGIAMANATPQLKEVAKMVTRGNDDDGVGLALQQLLSQSLEQIAPIQIK